MQHFSKYNNGSKLANSIIKNTMCTMQYYKKFENRNLD